MSMPTPTITILLAAALAAAMPAVAHAQDGAPMPARSTEAFQDWSVECTSFTPTGAAGNEAENKEKPQAERVCEAVQIYRNTKTNNEIARLAFAYGAKEGSKDKVLLAGLRTFVDVSFEKKPQIVIDDKPAFEGSFQRCAGSFCYAELTVPKGGAKSLEEAAKAALQFPISNGQAISITVSSKGLSDALKLLETRK